MSEPNDEQHDELERQLRLWGGDDSEIKTFLRDYARCKNQRGLKFFESVVRYHVFEPPSAYKSLFLPLDTTPSTVESPSEPLKETPSTFEWPSEHLDEEMSFSDLLQKLRPALQGGTADRARFLFLVSGTLDGVQSKMYPWSAKLFASVKQLQRKYTAPKLAILYLLDQEWNLSQITLEDCKGAIKREKKRISLVRPSQSLGRARFSIGSREEIILELAWLASVPKYLGHMRTYIWQPDAEPPETINARISIRFVEKQGRHNVLVLLTTSEDSDKLLPKDPRQIRDRLPGCSSTLSNAEAEILSVIYNLCMMLITDTNAFIKGALEQINDFKYKGRHSPHDTMIHYLLHLEDCCRESTSGLKKASSLIRELSDSGAPEHSQPDTVLKAWEDALEDIAVFREALDQAQNDLLDTRKMIYEQLNLRNGRLAGLLTLLAAIYIPFAFMAALFGMNLRNPLWGPVIPNSNSSASLPSSTPSSTSSTGLSQDQMNAIIAETAASSPYLWDFKLFWIIAGIMALATILLPLVGGPILRWTVKTFHRNRIYSRPLSALLLLGAYAAMDYFTPDTPYWYIFGISFGSVAGYTLVRASCTGIDEYIWCAYSIIFAASFTMDEIVGPLGDVGLCGYMSLTYLILVWLRPEVEQFVGHRLAQLQRLAQLLKQHLPTILSESLPRKVIAIILYYGLAVLLYFYLSKIGSLCFFSIPHFVFSTNRLIRNVCDRESRKFFPYWLIYAGIFWLSFIVTYMFPVYALTSFLPMAYLFAFWIFLGHKYDKDHKDHKRIIDSSSA